IAPTDCRAKIKLFDQTGVADPYFTGRFEETYQRVEKGCQQWLEDLKR
ncbi:low molecular weight phosphotyrosine protein phosphatase, partial [Streptococcus pyogenes]